MIRNLPEEEFPQNHQFKAHVINLMSSITLAVNNLNQPEIVVAMMNKLGESHGRRQIQEKHFDVSMKHIIELSFNHEPPLHIYHLTNKTNSFKNKQFKNSYINNHIID